MPWPAHCSGGLAAVAGGGGVAERRRHVAEARGERDVAQAADEGVGLGRGRPGRSSRSCRSPPFRSTRRAGVIGVVRQARVVDGPDAGVARQAARPASRAVGAGRGERRRASRPRAARASSRTGCPSGRTSRRPTAARSTSALEPATSPSVRSLWPPISFVSECVTASAPSASGRQSRGANVWSTTSRRRPAPRDPPARPSMSARRTSGFESVSAKTSRVAGRQRRRGASRAGSRRRRGGRPRTATARGRPGRRSCRRARRRARPRPPARAARNTADSAAIPEAQTSAGLGPFERRRPSRRAGRRWGGRRGRR